VGLHGEYLPTKHGFDHYVVSIALNFVIISKQYDSVLLVYTYACFVSLHCKFEDIRMHMNFLLLLGHTADIFTI